MPITSRSFSLLLVCAAVASAASAQTLPIEPIHETGASVTGAYEGWFHNPDGSYSFLLGYYNRNTAQELAIPAGPDNDIEPGGPDRGQPTYFLPGRQWGFFTVRVPADFGDKKLTWTIVANGQRTTIPFSLKPDYEVEPFREVNGNTPPAIAFDKGATGSQGPSGLTTTRTAKVGQPLRIDIWASDDAHVPSGSGAVSKTRLPYPVTLTWSKYRGPGNVTFSDAKPSLEKLPAPEKGFAYTGHSVTDVTFSEPGDYILNVVANDYSGEGGAGFQCCWTTGKVKVTVAR